MAASGPTGRRPGGDPKNLFKDLFLQDPLELFCERRDDVMDVADDTVGGYFEDRRIGVFIDGQYDF